MHCGLYSPFLVSIDAYWFFAETSGKLSELWILELN